MIRAFLAACFVLCLLQYSAAQTKPTAPPTEIEIKVRVAQETAKLSSADADARNMAAEALGDMGSAAASAVPSLVRRLRDRDANVRFTTAWALGHIAADPNRCVPALLAAMHDPDKDTRMQATLSLTAFPQQARRIVPKMIQGLRGKNEDTRFHCIQAIGSFGLEARPALPLLAALVTQGDDAEQFAGIGALREIGVFNEEVERSLLSAMKLNSGLVRFAAASALGEIDAASPAVLTGLAAQFTPDARSGEGVRPALSFTRLLYKVRAALAVRPRAEQSRLRTQCLAAQATLQNHREYYGNSNQDIPLALNQMDSILLALSDSP